MAGSSASLLSQRGRIGSGVGSGSGIGVGSGVVSGSGSSLKGSYEDLRIYVNGALLEEAPSVDVNGHVSGGFTAEAGTKSVEVWAEATATGEVSGGEALQLVVQSGRYMDSATASVEAEDCPDPVPGVPCGDEIDVDAIGV